MIGVAIAPVGIVGLLLAVGWFAGFGRRAAVGDDAVDRNRV
jgi:hypothetical protein